jgi:hypothetical protein
MIENKESEFAYMQEQEKNKLPDVITLPVLRVVNISKGHRNSHRCPLPPT